MGKIIAYCRVGCGYSEHTKTTLNEINQMVSRSNKTFNLEIKSVDNTEDAKSNAKEEANNLNNDHKLLNGHSTFPIIIYETSEKKYLFVGGNSELESIIKIINTSKYNFTNIESLTKCLTIKNFNTGQQRLFCYLLTMMDKIKF
jgi:glutaredoxin